MAKAIIARIYTYQVYKVVNKVSGKVYIGCTTQGYETRFKEHVRMANWRPAGYFHSALRKYGVDSFDLSLMGVYNDLTTMMTAEKQRILEHKSLAPNGYNMTTGGDGGFEYCDEVREKISKASKWRIVSEETKAKMSKAMTGRVATESSRANMSKARIGMKFSDSHIAAMSKVRKGGKGTTTGQPMGEAQKQKLRYAALLQWSNPDALAHISKVRKGRKTSESTKALIAVQAKNRWSDVSYREKLSVAFSIAQKAQAAERSLIMKAQWSDPIYREKMMLSREKTKLNSI